MNYNTPFSAGAGFASTALGVLVSSGRLKLALLMAAMAWTLASAYAQPGGTVNFGNHSSSLVTNRLTGAAVTPGDNVRAALYWAPLGSSTFAQLGAAATVGVPLPGLFVGGTRLSGPATAGGSKGLFQVRAWGGGYATYELALLQAGVLIGQSLVFTNDTGNPAGEPPSAPVSLLAGGLSGFTLTNNVGAAVPPVIIGSNSPVIAITKQCPPYPVPPGGTLAFTGTVTNTGNVTLLNVLVFDDQPAPNTVVYGVPSLAPGAGAQFTASYRVPPCSCGPFVDTLSASGISIDGGVATNYVTTSSPGTNAYALAGDLNGDGIVDQDELNAVLANYWATSQWLFMTNPTALGGGFFQFALTNAAGWNFTVLASTNLLDWTNVPGPAYPVYQFYDPEAASNSPMRMYRLRWP